jgi:hypothetical protein
MRLSKAHQILLPVSELLAQAEMEINNVTWYQSHLGVSMCLMAPNREQCKRITPLSHYTVTWEKLLRHFAPKRSKAQQRLHEIDTQLCESICVVEDA